jgi:hypothetical protein
MQNTKKIRTSTILIIAISLTIFIISIIVAGVILAQRNGYFVQESEQEDVHYHAGFQIYVNGKLRDYSADEFMHLESCNLKSDHEESSDPKERIHLHENYGDVTHVHAQGVTWRELFESLEIENILEVELRKTLLNGELAEDLIDREVGEYDWAVFVFGGKAGIQNDKIIENMITVDYIKEAESAIESCGS